MARPPGDPSTVAADLARLHAEFPGYRIWREVTGNRARLVAVRRHHGMSPHTVVTADPAELRAALAASTVPHEPGSSNRASATNETLWLAAPEPGSW